MPVDYHRLIEDTYVFHVVAERLLNDIVEIQGMVLHGWTVTLIDGEKLIGPVR